MATSKTQSTKPALSCQGRSGQNPNLQLLPWHGIGGFAFRARWSWVCRAGEEHSPSARCLLQSGAGLLSVHSTQGCRDHSCSKNLQFRLGFIPSPCYRTTSTSQKPSRPLLLIKGRFLKHRLLCWAVWTKDCCSQLQLFEQHHSLRFFSLWHLREEKE